MFDELNKRVIAWARDKGILERDNVHKQMNKVTEEMGELAGAILRDDEEKIIDGIGDGFVTLIILSKQMGLEPDECLLAAYDEIKDRKGKNKDGIFIKENE